MKYIKEYKEIDWDDWDDWDEEEIDPISIVTYDLDMLEYLYIMTGNSRISSSPPYMKLNNMIQQTRGRNVYEHVLTLKSKIDDLTDSDIKWLNDVNDIVNFKNLHECGFKDIDYYRNLPFKKINKDKFFILYKICFTIIKNMSIITIW